MKFIGITGGVGAGKSSVLSLLLEECNCKIVLADELAQELMTPGHGCNDKLRKLKELEGCFDESGFIMREQFANAMYGNDSLREKVNGIVHPAVQEEILHQVDEARINNKIQLFFFEAALLIECGYGKLCDELWYIYSSEETRRIRLKNSRGYSDEKIDAIMAAQVSEEFYKLNCNRVIDNDGSIEATRTRIQTILKTI